MGIILDSSVVIRAERRGDTAGKLATKLLAAFGDKEVALTAVGLVEIVHGLHRAHIPEIRLQRQEFLNSLLAEMPVHSFSQEAAFHAGRIDAEAQQRGVVSLDYSVATVNLRDFQRIPNLVVLKF